VRRGDELRSSVITSIKSGLDLGSSRLDQATTLDASATKIEYWVGAKNRRVYTQLNPKPRAENSCPSARVEPLQGEFGFLAPTQKAWDDHGHLVSILMPSIKLSL